MTDARRIHKLSMVSMLIAVAVALGYILAGVPNVEGISAVSFFAGCRLGAYAGAIVGGLAIGIFSLFNPLGPPVPHVLAAQVIGMGIIGAAGHVWGAFASKRRKTEAFKVHLPGSRVIRMRLPEIVAAAMGIVLTLIYGILVDYGFAVSIGRWNDAVPVILTGLPLSLLHIISNGLIFGGLGAFLIRRTNAIGEKGQA